MKGAVGLTQRGYSLSGIPGAPKRTGKHHDEIHSDPITVFDGRWTSLGDAARRHDPAHRVAASFWRHFMVLRGDLWHGYRNLSWAPSRCWPMITRMIRKEG